MTEKSYPRGPEFLAKELRRADIWANTCAGDPIPENFWEDENNTPEWLRDDYRSMAGAALLILSEKGMLHPDVKKALDDNPDEFVRTFQRMGVPIAEAPSKVTVNGQVHELLTHTNYLTYEEVVELAFPGMSHRILSVTYHNARGEKREGCLTPGQKVLITRMTKFSVADTSNA